MAGPGSCIDAKPASQGQRRPQRVSVRLPRLQGLKLQLARTETVCKYVPAAAMLHPPPAGQRATLLSEGQKCTSMISSPSRSSPAGVSSGSSWSPSNTKRTGASADGRWPCCAAHLLQWGRGGMHCGIGGQKQSQASDGDGGRPAVTGSAGQATAANQAASGAMAEAAGASQQGQPLAAGTIRQVEQPQQPPQRPHR